MVFDGYKHKTDVSAVPLSGLLWCVRGVRPTAPKQAGARMFWEVPKSKNMPYPFGLMASTILTIIGA
jgi:hypothetical protein